MKNVVRLETCCTLIARDIGWMQGITNTAGAIPGVLGVALVGIIFDQTHSWNLALFAPSIFFYLTGIMVWNVFASSEPQTFTS
jgi:ACS family sodium-dependent inorganic phosphate cotransporter